MSERVVAQELSLVRGLAGNDPKRRQRVVRTLRKWLAAREKSSFEFSEHDFDRLWKGLFYCVWMSDKPLVQEELCENIAKLFECFGNFSTSILFYKCFLKTMAKDWFGIDQHRFDKFLMLVRRVTRGLFYSLKKHDWSKDATCALEACLSEDGGLFAVPTLSEYRMALGLQLHLVDCWMEEVAKISEGNISSKVVTRLTKPFAYYLCNGQDSRLCSNIMKNIFTYLIKQTDLGIEYADKELAWRNAGYPGGNINAMEKVSDSEAESEEDDEEVHPPRKQALDPRAGYVDTVLPQLNVDGKEIASMLGSLLPESQVSCTNRTRIRSLIANFEKLVQGEYPLTAKDVVLPTDPKFKMPKVSKAALDLLDFEKEIDEKNDEKEFIGLSKRQKKRLLMKQRKKYMNQDEDTDSNCSEENDLIAPKKRKKSNNETSGIWHVEDVRNSESNDISPEKCVSDKLKKSSKTNPKVEKKGVNDHCHVNGFNNDSKQTNDTQISESNRKICANSLKSMSSSSDNVISNLIPSTLTPIKSESNTNSDSIKNSSTSTPLSSKNLLKKSVKINKNSPADKPSNPQEKLNKSKKHMNGDETEIIIPYKKLKGKNQMNKSDSEIMKSKSSKAKLLRNNLSTNVTPSKKVNIALAKNTSHAVVDYFKSVKQSPEIPFDGGKRPTKTSLKPNSMPSPVNPFYRNKLKLLI